MVMRPVQAARRPVSGFQQVNTPDRLANLDRPGRVDRSLQLALAERPHFEPHAAFGTLLAWQGSRVDEIHVAHYHADPLESERVEHGSSKDLCSGLTQFSPATALGRQLSLGAHAIKAKLGAAGGTPHCRLAAQRLTVLACRPQRDSAQIDL